jgi:hypothetical protein
MYPYSDRLDPIFYRERILPQCGERRKRDQEGKFCKRWIFTGAGGATYSPAIPHLRGSPPHSVQAEPNNPGPRIQDVYPGPRIQFFSHPFIILLAGANLFNAKIRQCKP